jgi:hypothetical protein
MITPCAKCKYVGNRDAQIPGFPNDFGMAFQRIATRGTQKIDLEFNRHYGQIRIDKRRYRSATTVICQRRHHASVGCSGVLQVSRQKCKTALYPTLSSIHQFDPQIKHERRGFENSTDGIAARALVERL